MNIFLLENKNYFFNFMNYLFLNYYKFILTLFIVLYIILNYIKMFFFIILPF